MGDADKEGPAALAELRRRLAEAEEKLSRSAVRERQLDAVLAHAPVVVFAIDEQGVFTLSEGRGLASAGLRPGQIVGSPAIPLYGGVEFTDAAGRKTDGEGVVRRVMAGEAYTGISHLGQSVYENHLIPVRDAFGRVAGLIGIATDVTERHRAQEERRKLEERLRQAQKMEAIGRLAGGVAHDFNNLLTAIMGGIQLALDGLPPQDPLRVDLQDSLDASTRAAALTRQLLAFSRKQPLQPRSLDLDAVVRELSSMLRRLLGEAVALEIDPGPSPLRVCVDLGQLEQVIVNLVVNARDAGASRVRIALDRAQLDAGAHPGAPPGPYAVLAVSDDGAGMDAEVLERLFEPFFTTKEAGRGTGLGLPTVHGVVQQSGGHVTVESAVGRGSTFRVFLPETGAPGGGEESAPTVAATAPAAAGGRTILVAEDEAAVRVFVVKALARAGYRVLEADDAEEAVALARELHEPIDLLLADVVMPGGSGPELAARLRTERPGLRVLFISGYLDDAAFARAQAGDGGEVLLKPLSVDALLARVARALAAAPR